MRVLPGELLPRESRPDFLNELLAAISASSFASLSELVTDSRLLALPIPLAALLRRLPSSCDPVSAIEAMLGARDIDGERTRPRIGEDAMVILGWCTDPVAASRYHRDQVQGPVDDGMPASEAYESTIGGKWDDKPPLRSLTE